jgi:hypothetical protein
MADHLSWLVADEVAAGLKAVPPHAGTCPLCQERLRQAAAAHARVLKAPEFAKQLEKHTTSVRPTRWTWTWRLAPALALAAALLVVVWIRPLRPNVDRIKGTPVLELREPGTATRVTRTKVGTRLSLTLGGAGHRYGLVVGVDDQAGAAALWQGEVPAGAAAPVSPEFEVTPGALALFAFYADEPLEPNRALENVRAAAIEAKRAGRSARDAVPLPVPGEKARAQATLDVDPRPP